MDPREHPGIFAFAKRGCRRELPNNRGRASRPSWESRETFATMIRTILVRRYRVCRKLIPYFVLEQLADETNHLWLRQRRFCSRRTSKKEIGLDLTTFEHRTARKRIFPNLYPVSSVNKRIDLSRICAK